MNKSYKKRKRKNEILKRLLTQSERKKRLKPPFNKAFKAGSEHKKPNQNHHQKTNLITKTEPKPNPKNEPENRTEKQTEPPPPKIKMQSKNSL
jgi:hypothetical protein